MAISRRSKLKTSCSRCSNLVTRPSAPLAGPGHALFRRPAESLTNGFFVESHHRVAIVFLIAGVDQGVEGERVIVGRRDVLFDERARGLAFRFR